MRLGFPHRLHHLIDCLDHLGLRVVLAQVPADDRLLLVQDRPQLGLTARLSGRPDHLRCRFKTRGEAVAFSGYEARDRTRLQNVLRLQTRKRVRSVGFPLPVVECWQ